MMQNYIASDNNSDYSPSDDDEDNWDAEEMYKRKIQEKKPKDD